MNRLVLMTLLLVSVFQAYSMNEKNIIESKETTIASRDSDEGWIHYCQSCGRDTPRSTHGMYRDVYKYLLRCGVNPRSVHVTLLDGDRSGFIAKTNSKERRFSFDKRWWNRELIRFLPYVFLHEIGHLIDQSAQKIARASDDRKLLAVREAELRADNFAIKKLVEWSHLDIIMGALKMVLNPALQGQGRSHELHPTYVEEYKNMAAALKELHYDIVCSFSIENSKVYITLLKNGKPVGNKISFRSQSLAALIASIIMMNKQQEQEDKEIYG
jgi:hypothetical protein